MARPARRVSWKQGAVMTAQRNNQSFPEYINKHHTG